MEAYELKITGIVLHSYLHISLKSVAEIYVL